ncbi:MAG: Tex family protein [Xanthomonadales bacterium]|nr:Tex family protein [Xanthomonadales bacterium]
MPDITARIASEIEARSHQVDAAIRLFDAGATVPFVARYRKEATGGLDDGQLRRLQARLAYLRDLEERRKRILAAIEEHGDLDASLRQAIEAAETKTRLEDLYLPFKPQRQTRAQRARDAGLQPLAEQLRSEPETQPLPAAERFIDPDRGIADAEAALDGARAILIEALSEEPDLVGDLRELAWRHGRVRTEVVPGREKAGRQYADYFDFSEPIRSIASHRLLAALRARAEGCVKLDLALPDETTQRSLRRIGEALAAGADHHGWLGQTVEHAWRQKIRPHLVLDLIGRARERAEAEAIRVFSANLHDLLMAPPGGPQVVLGLDPGLRSGVKAAVVDETGQVLTTATIYPHAPQGRWEEAREKLVELIRTHRIALVAVGDGKASRRTLRLVREVAGEQGPAFEATVVSEAGASVYSASALAAAELPDLDVALRGAVSIARRLQDPLAELVKIDPKAIGVGQYQHDVNQIKLAAALDAEVEDCVNAVGVALNTASPQLLARVSGLGPALAERIVEYRDIAGPFPSRESLKGVTGVGPQTFQQAAGFLRIAGGDNPLDATGVHPEAYPVVERVLAKVDRPLEHVMGNRELLGALDPEGLTCDCFGPPTVGDILDELARPGRDPRPRLMTARFADGVRTMDDLEVGQVLEGIVTNVTNFGAFVNIGIEQDALLHISEMADRYVKDPRSEVRAGEVVKVRILEIDLDRRRVSLSKRPNPSGKKAEPTPSKRQGAFGSALADALTRARKKSN